MSEVIAIVSGKGGVGKTTLTANLGIALSELNKKVLLIDADIAMSNLSLLIGLENPPITLHDVLLGSSSSQDATYDAQNGLKIIPSGLSISNYQRVDSERLVSVVKSLIKEYDYILIDAPAGIDKNVISAMSASTQILLVTEPTAPAVADVFKAKIVAERLNQRVLGVVVNKVSNIKGEITEKEIMKMLELPSYGQIPYSEDVRESFLLKKIKPVLVHAPNSPSSNSFRYIARKITGIDVDSSKKIIKKKKGFFGFLKNIFKKKKK
ncbi:MAG: cell division ATPase MinD [archaeon]|jgi:septum site-determining protein MinD|nr:cell division ATPase MinD [archaeon]MDD2477547.1 cell division ATPase MinD [Candidatus ainarchaeum sp.]MDD3084357.1 cell division ATPase MinD [Candidatus ainarchaeum sp.]MDD4221464.1 cell division ATPase MinD [Candidatus ainarchaeum sp.]MDD4662570.1 cell division ATPase MinD [Candidatus ainarchaeum sp.]